MPQPPGKHDVGIPRTESGEIPCTRLRTVADARLEQLNDVSLEDRLNPAHESDVLLVSGSQPARKAVCSIAVGADATTTVPWWTPERIVS